MGSSGACNSPSTAFGGGFGHGVSGKCRKKCKCISRKVAGGGLRLAERGERETDRECPGEGIKLRLSNCAPTCGSMQRARFRTGLRAVFSTESMGSSSVQRLSKSRYMSGLQCPKMLWWRVHEPDAPELAADEVLQALSLIHISEPTRPY